MTKYINRSIYFPSDKNIYDALLSKAVTRKVLDELLIKKGILRSSLDDRRDLSEYISRITFDYYDYIFLAEILEKTGQRDKITNCSVSTPIKNDEITSACQAFKDSDHSFDHVKVMKKGNKTVVEVIDTEVDFTKTELKQKTKKTYRHEFVNSDSGLNVRYFANDKSEEILEAIIGNISNIKDESIEPKKISLKSIQSSEKRNEFFINLINYLPDHRLYDVQDIEVHQNSDDIDILLEDEEDEPLSTEEKSQLSTGFIRKISLAGIGVLNSPEFVDLNKKGFFISKINWTAIDQSSSEANKIEFEALFGDPKNCIDFKYMVKGFYPYIGDDYTTTRKKLSSLDASKKLEYLEKTAREAYEKVSEDVNVESSEKVLEDVNVESSEKVLEDVNVESSENAKI